VEPDFTGMSRQAVQLTASGLLVRAAAGPGRGGSGRPARRPVRPGPRRHAHADVTGSCTSWSVR